MIRALLLLSLACRWVFGADAARASDSVPWLGLALLALLSLLPLPLFLLKREVPLQDLRSPVSVLCLVQGGMWLSAGLFLLQWIDRLPGRGAPSLSGAALLLLLLGTGFVAVGFLILKDHDDEPESASRPTFPVPGRAALEVITQRTQVFPAPQALDRYRRQIWIWGGIATFVALSGPSAGWGLEHEQRTQLYLQWLLLGGVPILSLVLGWLAISRRIEEHALSERCKGRELRLDEEGMRISLALLTHAHRRRLRLQRKEAWVVPWSEILEVRGEQGGALRPARLVIRLRGDRGELVVDGQFFPTKIEEIASRARERLVPSRLADGKKDAR